MFRFGNLERGTGYRLSSMSSLSLRMFTSLFGCFFSLGLILTDLFERNIGS